MDKRLQVDVIYIDFIKIFDRINHFLLIIEFKKVEIHISLLRWIEL